MVERLLAHARICREIANITLNQQTARGLELLAEDCVQAARDAEPAPRFRRFQSPTASGRAAGWSLRGVVPIPLVNQAFPAGASLAYTCT
jgi:hypothetical protein